MTRSKPWPTFGPFVGSDTDLFIDAIGFSNPCVGVRFAGAILPKKVTEGP
jgi:hypothetical protein